MFADVLITIVIVVVVAAAAAAVDVGFSISSFINVLGWLLQVAAGEKEKEQINAQYLELWRKNYAQPAEASDVSTVSKVVELETALESREGRLKQLSLQVSIRACALQVNMGLGLHLHARIRIHTRTPRTHSARGVQA